MTRSCRQHRRRPLQLRNQTLIVMPRPRRCSHSVSAQPLQPQHAKLSVRKQLAGGAEGIARPGRGLRHCSRERVRTMYGNVYTQHKYNFRLVEYGIIHVMLCGVGAQWFVCGAGGVKSG